MKEGKSDSPHWIEQSCDLFTLDNNLLSYYLGLLSRHYINLAPEMVHLTSPINLHDMEAYAIIRNRANDDMKRRRVYARKDKEGHL